MGGLFWSYYEPLTVFLGKCLVAVEFNQTLFELHRLFVVLFGGNGCVGMCMLLFSLYNCKVCIEDLILFCGICRLSILA